MISASSLVESIVTVAVIAAFFMAVIFGVYTVLIVVPYLKRDRWEDGNPKDYRWHFLVP